MQKRESDVDMSGVERQGVSSERETAGTESGLGVREAA